jgi:hypothetical protein
MVFTFAATMYSAQDPICLALLRASAGFKLPIRSARLADRDAVCARNVQRVPGCRLEKTQRQQSEFSCQLQQGRYGTSAHHSIFDRQGGSHTLVRDASLGLLHVCYRNLHPLTHDISDVQYVLLSLWNMSARAAAAELVQKALVLAGAHWHCANACGYRWEQRGVPEFVKSPMGLVAIVRGPADAPWPTNTSASVLRAA